MIHHVLKHFLQPGAQISEPALVMLLTKGIKRYYLDGMNLMTYAARAGDLDMIGLLV